MLFTLRELVKCVAQIAVFTEALHIGNYAWLVLFFWEFLNVLMKASSEILSLSLVVVPMVRRVSNIGFH